MSKNNQLMLGYESFTDLTISAFGLKQPIVNIIGAIIATFTTFITSYVYDDARAVYTLIAIILLDAITGITRSVKQGKFSSARLPRILAIIILYTGLLSIGWNLSKISSLYSWIPAMLYGGFVTTLIVSIFENAHEIGLIPDNIYYYLKTKINLLQQFVFGASFNTVPPIIDSKNPIGIYQTNVEGTLTYVDSRLCSMVNLTKEDILQGSKLKSMLHPEDYSSVYANWMDAIKKKAPFYSSHRLILSDKTIITIVSRATPMIDHEGLLIGYLGTFERIDPTPLS